MDEKTNSTKDIYLAAACIANGAELIDTVRTDPKHLRFVFDFQTGSLDEAEAAYLNGKLMVSASKYADAIRHLKSIIHASD